MTNGKPQLLSAAEREQVVTEYVRFATFLAAKQGQKISNPSVREELHGVARLALVQAAIRFDKSIGVQFKIFASFVINGAMLDFMRHEDPMPRAARRRFSQVLRAQRGLPTSDSLNQAIDALPACCDDTKFFLKEAAERLLRDGRNAAVISLNVARRTKTSDEPTLIDPPSGAKSPEAIAAEKETAQVVQSVLSALPVRWRYVIEKLFYTDDEGATQKAVGRDLGVNESRVSQLKSQAVKRLRKSPQLQQLAI